MFRRMPDNVVECDPELYRFLIRHPEVVVNIWQLMGITKVDIERKGPFTLDATDGVGTVTETELVYGTHDTHLIYCEGSYEGPLFPRPLTGRCVLLLKSDFASERDDRWQVTNRLDVFLQVDHVGVDAFTRTLHPLFGKSADLNFVESTKFLERISRTSEENGPGMQRLAERLDKVEPDVRSRFAELTTEVYHNAQQRLAAVRIQRQGPRDAPVRIRPATQRRYQPASTLRAGSSRSSSRESPRLPRLPDVPSHRSHPSACTITRTEHQAGSSSELTVGESNPGVICSASARCCRRMLYSSSE